MSRNNGVASRPDFFGVLLYRGLFTWARENQRQDFGVVLCRPNETCRDVTNASANFGFQRAIYFENLFFHKLSGALPAQFYRIEDKALRRCSRVVPYDADDGARDAAAEVGVCHLHLGRERAAVRAQGHGINV